MLKQSLWVKNILILCSLFSLLALMSSCFKGEENWPVDSSKCVTTFTDQKGPYLGQELPGKNRELFAPGLISDGLFNGLVYFTTNGTEVYFTSGFEKPIYTSIFFFSRLENGSWTEPTEFSLDRLKFFRPVLSPDGNKVFFISSRMEEAIEGETNLIKIYYVEKEDNGWSTPQVIDFGESFPYSCGQASVAANGNLYFQAGYHIDGDEDIYLSRYEDGTYQAPVRLPDTINGPEHDVHPFIAADESYLIFDAQRPDGLGNNDLYISFKDQNGQWTEARNMGPNINTAADERRASVSTDGKYLFFEGDIIEAEKTVPAPPITLTELRKFLGSPKNGGADVYWADIMVLEDLRPR